MYTYTSTDPHIHALILTDRPTHPRKHTQTHIYTLARTLALAIHPPTHACPHPPTHTPTRTHARALTHTVTHSRHTSLTGMYLSDLTFLEDGNPDHLTGTDLINVCAPTPVGPPPSTPPPPPPPRNVWKEVYQQRGKVVPLTPSTNRKNFPLCWSRRYRSKPQKGVSGASCTGDTRPACKG